MLGLILRTLEDKTKYKSSEILRFSTGKYHSLKHITQPSLPIPLSLVYGQPIHVKKPRNGMQALKIK